MHHENEKMALFEALYREYLVPLKKYAYRIGVGYDDIEDMVHEAFIEYYKRYSLDLDHKVKLVLLIRILRSKWIDNRRQMRRREMLHLEDPDAEEEIMNLLLEGEIGIQLLDQEVIDRDIYWNVWKIVKSMKKDWRDVLILRSGGIDGGRSLCGFENQINGMLYTSLQGKSRTAEARVEGKAV